MSTMLSCSCRAQLQTPCLSLPQTSHVLLERWEPLIAPPALPPRPHILEQLEGDSMTRTAEPLTAVSLVHWGQHRTRRRRAGQKQLREDPGSSRQRAMERGSRGREQGPLHDSVAAPRKRRARMHPEAAAAASVIAAAAQPDGDEADSSHLQRREPAQHSKGPLPMEQPLAAPFLQRPRKERHYTRRVCLRGLLPLAISNRSCYTGQHSSMSSSSSPLGIPGQEPSSEGMQPRDRELGGAPAERAAAVGAVGGGGMAGSGCVWVSAHGRRPLSWRQLTAVVARLQEVAGKLAVDDQLVSLARSTRTLVSWTLAN